MKRITIILLLFVMAAGLVMVGPLNRRLVDERRRHGITQTDPLVNAPPLVVFTTVALGGFRGIISDLLWMRSARLQQEGRYFELVQLADWITKLEPRFTDVWAYHAWNLAYNISVLFTDPADRWRWVRHGISLLRDDGLRYNPDEARLLFELGWLFQHKIGGFFDDAHMHYKQEWAAEMQELLGGGRPDYDLLLNDPQTLAALTRQYKLNPDLMREIEIQYGPLDWRLPQAHAIYWATKSRRVGRDFDVVQANRMIYQAMADAFRRGYLYVGPNGNRFIPAPYPDLLPYVMQTYDDMLNDPHENATALGAYQFFLSEAAVLLYMYNRLPEARRAFSRLKEINPDIDPGKDLLSFIFETYTSRGMAMNPDEAYFAVESALYQSILWRMAGDPERAAGYDQLARLVWNRYMAPRLDNPALRERTGLPPIEEIRDNARQRAAQNAAGAGF